MNSKHTNANANVPEQESNEPLGDRGKGDKTWTPGEEQGISNRLGDDAEEEKDGEDEDDNFDEDDDEDGGRPPPRLSSICGKPRRGISS